MGILQDRAAGLARLLALLAVGGASLAHPQDAVPESAPAAATAPARVVLQTFRGNIEVEIDTQRAPVTAANFLRYVDEKRYDGITLYRAMKLTEDGKYGLVQGGPQGDRNRLLPPIAHEPTSATGLSHVDGALSMARFDPGTATAEFFFIVGDLPSLDAKEGGDPGYAVFGRVITGMDIVRGVLELPRSDTADNATMKGQMLAEPVKIVVVRRVP